MVTGALLARLALTATMPGLCLMLGSMIPFSFHFHAVASIMMAAGVALCATGVIGLTAALLILIWTDK